MKQRDVDEIPSEAEGAKVTGAADLKQATIDLPAPPVPASPAPERSRWQTFKERLGTVLSRGEASEPASEREQRPPARSEPAATGPPQEQERGPDGGPPRASSVPVRSVEEVARDKRVAKRVVQIQDPHRRAEAERLLRTIREEAAARDRSTHRAQEGELER